MSTNTEPVASSGDGGAPRKGMRKGTHSCVECRRRKIRCIYPAVESNTCIGCKTRGATCVSQTRELIRIATAESKSDLKQKIAKLEAVVEILAPGADKDSIDLVVAEKKRPCEAGFFRDMVIDHAAATSTSDSLTSSPVPKPFDTQFLNNNNPISLIFDNTVWQRTSDAKRAIDGHTEYGTATAADSDETDQRILVKRRSTCQALLSGQVAPKILEELLKASNSWWYAWYPLAPWADDSTNEEKLKTLQEFVGQRISSDNPSTVGLAILCIAVSIHQLDRETHEHIICQLPNPPEKIFQEYVEKVHRLIVRDGEFASSKEGIKVTVMLATVLMNFGLIKKSWTMNRQAMSYAQLLGFHCRSRLSPRESDAEMKSRQRVFLSMCKADVYISLLQNLPYMSDGRTVPVDVSDGNGTQFWWQHKLIGLSARVIDRNQMGLQLNFSATQEILNELDFTAQQMGDLFWDAPAIFANGQITRDEYIEQITGQFWYFQIRVCLYMPLMMQSADDPKLEVYRQSCLDASRSLLKLYQFMRADAGSVFSMCKVIDFQSFICSALLLLGLMGYGNSSTVFQSKDWTEDRELVQSALNVLRKVSSTEHNYVASQALKGLETLTTIADLDPNKITEVQCSNASARIVVPSAGTITISAGDFVRKRQMGLYQSNSNQPSNFNFFHDGFQPSQQPDTAQMPAVMPSNDLGGLGEQYHMNLETPVMGDFPSIDFDWGSIVNMNTDEDLAWLMSENGNGMNGYM